MDLSLLFYLFCDFYRFTLPKVRIGVSDLVDRRNAYLKAKQVTPCEDFNKKYREIVLPYWKQFDTRPSKGAFKLIWSDGRDPDPRYLPNDIWSKVITHYNNVYEYSNLADKSIQELFVTGLRYPDTLVKRVFGLFYTNDFQPLTEAEACERVRAEGSVIIKQSIDSFGGKGVRFVDVSGMSDEEILSTLCVNREDFIVQRLLKQHPTLSAINDSSINTIRLVTFFHKGEVHLLNAVLRIGGAGSRTDNITGGGYACPIHPDGTLYERAISREAGWATHHPSGVAFKDICVPNFTGIVDQVKAAAARIPYFKIVGWDIAVDENAQPVVIEFNVRPEQNQKSCGPSFGDLTDEVLAEALKKERIRLTERGKFGYYMSHPKERQRR